MIWALDTGCSMLRCQIHVSMVKLKLKRKQTNATKSRVRLSYCGNSVEERNCLSGRCYRVMRVAASDLFERAQRGDYQVAVHSSWLLLLLTPARMNPERGGADCHGAARCYCCSQHPNERDIEAVVVGESTNCQLQGHPTARCRIKHQYGAP